MAGLLQVKLSSISSVTLLDKRGFLTICLSLGSVREGRIYLRRAEGLREWFQLLKVSVGKYYNYEHLHYILVSSEFP